MGCDDAALAAGANLAVIGREVIQFGVATPLGDGKFRLSRLLRGRGGTEWARSDHIIGETVCLPRPGTLQPVALPPWSIGAEVSATTAGSSAVTVFKSEALRPLSPVNLRAEFETDGDLRLRWTRRSRVGFAWIDGVDVPLGEASERYRVAIAGSAASIEFSATTAELLIEASTLASVGPGSAAVEVAQIGDFLSSPSELLEIFIA